MVLRRSRGEIRTAEGGNTGKMLARGGSSIWAQGSDTVVRAVLQGEASAACCQRICRLETPWLWAQPAATRKCFVKGQLGML